MKKHRVLKISGLIILTILLLMAAAVGTAYLYLGSAAVNIERVDENGLLYSMDYTADYDNALIRLPVRLVKAVSCSAFSSRNEEGDVITARNYDLMHTDAEGNATGLNVVLRLRPEGKYASVNIADAAWLTMAGIPYTAGALDEGNANRAFLAFLPYLCMDGMNEKGLTVSILAVNIKDGETATDQKETGKRSVMITELLRMMLDTCANVEEAAALAGNCNMKNVVGTDYHLFVTDAEGNSVVMEWRYNTLYLTCQDVVTNFYVGFDDAEDNYLDGRLRETFVRAEGLAKEYRYGYGHGYGRFNTLAEMLDEHITDPVTLVTTVNESDAMDMLAAASQTNDGTDLTSNTQYSVIYNASELTAEVCVMRDYSRHYFFSLDG